MNNFELNDLATGLLKMSNVLGRAVDIIMNDDGVVFVSDNDVGEVYRAYYGE